MLFPKNTHQIRRPITSAVKVRLSPDCQMVKQRCREGFGSLINPRKQIGLMMSCNELSILPGQLFLVVKVFRG